MRYRVSADASADLDTIWEYLAKRASAETATTFVGRFHDTFSSVASSPRAGVDVTDLPGNVRKFPIGNCLIYYRSMPGGIVIVRVLHGKRAQKKVFLKKPKP